jgi:hypothetical protein
LPTSVTVQRWVFEPYAVHRSTLVALAVRAKAVCTALLVPLATSITLPSLCGRASQTVVGDTEPATTTSSHGAGLPLRSPSSLPSHAFRSWTRPLTGGAACASTVAGVTTGVASSAPSAAA